MPTNTPQQTLEPVHVRADQHSPAPATSHPVTPPPSEAGKTTPIALPAVLKTQQPAVKKSPEQSSNGVTAAIVATVIIVLGLAALAVLAYIKTKK